MQQRDWLKDELERIGKELAQWVARAGEGKSFDIGRDESFATWFMSHQGVSWQEARMFTLSDWKNLIQSSTWTDEYWEQLANLCREIARHQPSSHQDYLKIALQILTALDKQSGVFSWDRMETIRTLRNLINE